MPDPNRVWAQTTTGINAIYDEYARPYAGIYYWRVRGIDAESNTVGTWSDTASFMVDPTKRKRIYAAILGDSITHGGGAISNSPALPEYSYTTYLSFDCLNLGRSGDTSHTTLERFDADVLPIRPLNLLILTGSNSLRDDQISAQDIIEDLSHIQEKCIENHIHPVFLTILPLNPNAIALAFQTETDPAWHDKLHQVNAWIRTQDHYIDLEPYFYDETETILAPMMSTDGLHPDIRGKLHMAEIINAHRDQLRERAFFE
jgi:Lysophospholipase L1 and related esterases